MDEKAALREHYHIFYGRGSNNQGEHHTKIKRNNMSASRSFPKHNVHFSECSMMYLYPEVHYQEKRTLSYKPSDRKAATRNALHEAVRIKTMLLSRPNKSNAPLHVHLAKCGIPKEEIVGIEHFISEDPARALERRRTHLRVILMEQESQRTAGGTEKDNGRRLAELSALLTKRPASQARSRAGMAA